MATPPTTYDQMLSQFNSLVYNPSNRFFTPGDIQNYINQAASETANEIGGIRVIDTTTLSEANQRDYTLDNGVRKIVEARYVQNIGAANEMWTELDIITLKDNAFIQSIGVPGGNIDPLGLTISGQPQPVPKYAIFFPTLNILRLLDTPSVSGDTVWLDCLEVPNTLATGIQYNGDNLELGAIVYKAVSLARLKERETGESNVFDGKWMKACEGIKKMRGKMRQVRQAGDGRFSTTRLRSINGAK